MSYYTRKKSIVQDKLNLIKPTSGDTMSGATVGYVVDVYKSVMGNSGLTNLNTDNTDSVISAINEVNSTKMDNYVEYNKTVVGNSANTASYVDIISEWVSTNTTQEVGQKRYNYTQVDMMYQSGIDVYVDAYFISNTISTRSATTINIIPSAATTKYFIPYRIDAYVSTFAGTVTTPCQLNIGVTSTNYADIVSGATILTPYLNKLYSLTLINTSRINITNGLYVKIATAEVGVSNTTTINFIIKGLIMNT